ncbi:MAG: hypothetical protein HC912_06070 [Saprospiraceae bacterium]|nr:hypothetical protein [Saprospiraceae bacterium]
MPYLTKLSTLQPSSLHQAMEIDYLMGYYFILQKDFVQAEEQLKKTIVAAYKNGQSNFYDLLSRCYNALGYLNAMRQPVEMRNKQIMVLHKRTLFNSRTLFEEALRYNPQHKVAANNYNRVNTALQNATQPH